MTIIVKLAGTATVALAICGCVYPRPSHPALIPGAERPVILCGTGERWDLTADEEVIRFACPAVGVDLSMKTLRQRKSFAGYIYVTPDIEFRRDFGSIRCDAGQTGERPNFAARFEYGGETLLGCGYSARVAGA